MRPPPISSFLFCPGDEDVGQRIDKALGRLPDIGSRSRAEFLIESGHVTKDGKPLKASHKIQAGDEYRVEIPPAPAIDLKPYSLSLEILFEDEDVLVINKPGGLVVHPAAGHPEDTLVNALIHREGFNMKFGEIRPGIVHRLDKDTSGLLVIAKNDLAQIGLVEQFKARKVKRRYQAVAWSRDLKSHGTIQSFLARHPTDRKRYASVRSTDRSIIRDPSNPPHVGKWAVTHYQVLQKKTNGLCRLGIRLETGRTHQIRVHLSEIGAPILADPIYGKSPASMKGLGKAEQALVESLPRLCLHAEQLGFRHPRTGELLEFHTEWPEDLAPHLQRLGVL